MAKRCKHCGRKVVWIEKPPDLPWPTAWYHKKSNLRHCDYTDNLAEPQ